VQVYNNFGVNSKVNEWVHEFKVKSVSNKARLHLSLGVNNIFDNRDFVTIFQIPLIRNTNGQNLLGRNYTLSASWQF
jgi:outer membrane receptor protein involved in Fe transport